MRRGGLVELDVGAGAGSCRGGGGRLHHPDDLRGPEAVAEGDEADPGQEGQDRGEEAHGPELDGSHGVLHDPEGDVVEVEAVDAGAVVDEGEDEVEQHRDDDGEPVEEGL